MSLRYSILAFALLFLAAACSAAREGAAIATASRPLVAAPSATNTLIPASTPAPSATPRVAPTRTLVPTLQPFFDPFPTGPTPTALFLTPQPYEQECERDESSQDLRVDLSGIPETCVVWVDESEDETGFLIVLKYWSGGEIFVYEFGPDITQLFVPHEHAPRLDESQEQFLRRHDIQVSVLALRPNSKTSKVGDMGLIVDNPDLRKLPTATATNSLSQ